jgi:hypothetical protein
MANGSEGSLAREKTAIGGWGGLLPGVPRMPGFYRPAENACSFERCLFQEDPRRRAPWAAEQPGRGGAEARGKRFRRERFPRTFI